MRDAIRELQRLRGQLDGAFGSARLVWRDDNARLYESRFHQPMVGVFDAFVRAAERLTDSIEDAEQA